MPWEYIEYRLMKDLYHCTPKELENDPYEVLVRHWSFMQAEAHQAKIQKKRDEQQARLNRMRR